MLSSSVESVEPNSTATSEEFHTPYTWRVCFLCLRWSAKEKSHRKRDDKEIVHKLIDTEHYTYIYIYKYANS